MKAFRIASLFLVAPFALAAQANGAEAPASTRAGVFTDAQSERGRMIYAATCKSCHQPSTGAVFERNWKGKSLADLVGFMSAQMPKNDPGSLEPQEYADVAAYLLKVNAMPAGKREIGTDLAALGAVKIEMPAVSARKLPASARTKDRRAATAKKP